MEKESKIVKRKYEYTYWLKMEDDLVEEAWVNLKEYKEKYDCNMEIFYRETSCLYKIIKLECNQNYQDLDLDVNSSSTGSLTRLLSRPKNICKYKRSIEDFFKLREEFFKTTKFKAE